LPASVTLAQAPVLLRKSRRSAGARAAEHQRQGGGALAASVVAPVMLLWVP
jgi:hypothetical protein